MTFKERNRELQELVREYTQVHSHNLKFKEGDPQDTMLLFAEGALVLLVLERFLRILPGMNPQDNESVYNLLQRATGGDQPMLRLGVADREKAIRQITDVRNSLQHGN